MGKATLKRVFNEEEVKGWYGSLATSYDLWAAIIESRAARRAVELASVRTGQDVLEVAVGTGLVFERLVKLNPGGVNRGVDLTPGMLKRTRRRLEGAGLANYVLGIANAYDLPFQDESFDLVMNNYMLDLIPEEDFLRILGGFRRVLKPGGRLVLSSMTTGRRWYNHIWEMLAAWLPSALVGCRPVGLEGYLQEAGFVNIISEYISQNTFASEVLRAEKPANDHFSVPHDVADEPGMI